MTNTTRTRQRRLTVHQASVLLALAQGERTQTYLALHTRSSLVAARQAADTLARRGLAMLSHHDDGEPVYVATQAGRTAARNASYCANAWGQL